MKLFDKVRLTYAVEIPGSTIWLPSGSIGIVMNPAWSDGRVQVEFENRKSKTYNLRRDALELVAPGR